MMETRCGAVGLNIVDGRKRPFLPWNCVCKQCFGGGKRALHPAPAEKIGFRVGCNTRAGSMRVAAEKERF